MRLKTLVKVDGREFDSAASTKISQEKSDSSITIRAILPHQ